MEDVSLRRNVIVRDQYVKEQKRFVYVKFMALEKYLTVLSIVPVKASLFPSGTVGSSFQ